MSKKHERTLAAIKAVKVNIKWSDIESMLVHFGAEISERRGSRVAVALNDVVAVFHRPHPSPEASKPLVKSVKQFIENAGL